MSPKKLFPILALACFVCCLWACHSTVSNNTGPTATSPGIEQLITQGEHLESGNIDSLPIITKQLQRLANKDSNKVASIYARVFKAHYLWMRSDHKAAMNIVVATLADADKWKVNRAVSELYGIMANLYKENTDYKMAFEAADKGLDAAIAIKDTSEIIGQLGQKAMFTHSAWLNKYQKVDRSLEFELAALKMVEANPKYQRMRTRFYDNISQYYKDVKDYDKAIQYGNMAAPLAYKYHQLRSLTYCYCWLGESWYFKGDHAKGLMYLDSALRIAGQIKEPYRQMEVYMSLTDCAMFSADYKKALEYTRIYRQLHDSLQVQSNTKQISELQIRYETAKKDQEIAILDKSTEIKNREIIFIISGALILVAFGALLLLQARVIHRHNQVIKSKNTELNRALEDIGYIQSHEIRKPVASILGLINIIKADDYQTDKDTLQKLEAVANELDDKIKDINTHAQKK